jgi:septal ring factor EnvC (AmiA/AmiB activator)
MKKRQKHPAAGLQGPLAKTEAVTAEIERASAHALVIGTVLAKELPVAQAIEQTEDLEQKLAESAETLADVSAALETEIAERGKLSDELAASREAIEQLETEVHDAHAGHS